MGRLIVALDPSVNVKPDDLASTLNATHGTFDAGLATVEAARPGDFLGVVDLVVIPAGVGLAVNGVTAMLGSLVRKLRAPADEAELEIVEMTRTNGDRIVVVRICGISK